MVIVVNRRSLDPIAWIRKYLIMASNSWNFEELIITGINDSIFNSSPIHIVSQLFDDNTMIIDVGIMI